MNVFDLPHIFIVFPPGAGGNFIAGLLTKLTSNDLTALGISSVGSSHTTMDKKKDGKDYLSFGTFIESRSKFNTPEDRINFFRSKITDITTPQVTWTHDKNNIDDYTNVFPNAKILVITTDSEQEQLVTTFMYCVKNMLDPTAPTPWSTEQRQRFMEYWNSLLKDDLSKVVPTNRIPHAMEDQDLAKYFHIIRKLKSYRLLEYKDEPIPPAGLLDPEPYNISKYINNRCTVLPYKYLIDNDLDLLLSCLSEIVPMNKQQEEYVTEMFNAYRMKQDLNMLENPYEFLRQLTMTADAKIKALNI